MTFRVHDNVSVSCKRLRDGRLLKHENLNHILLVYEELFSMPKNKKQNLNHVTARVNVIVAYLADPVRPCLNNNLEQEDWQPQVISEARPEAGYFAEDYASLYSTFGNRWYWTFA